MRDGDLRRGCNERTERHAARASREAALHSCGAVQTTLASSVPGVRCLSSCSEVRVHHNERGEENPLARLLIKEFTLDLMLVRSVRSISADVDERRDVLCCVSIPLRLEVGNVRAMRAVPLSCQLLCRSP